MLYKHFVKQEEIDLEYNPRMRVADIQVMLDYYVNDSKRVRATFDHLLDIPYGPTLAEHFDYFPARGSNRPLHVFFHGGYWHSFSSKEFALVAEAFLNHDINVALVNYALCPQVSLDEIVRQCRAAIAFLYQNGLDLGYDPEQISISGHSAGGHLVGMVLTTDWEGIYGLSPNLIKSACTFSGLFNLAPFPFSWLQPKLQLTWDQVHRNSPIYHTPTIKGPVTVVVGADESEEFQDQSQQYLQSLEEASIDTQALILENRNHFNLLEDFSGQGGPLFQAIHTCIL